MVIKKYEYKYELILLLSQGRKMIKQILTNCSSELLLSSLAMQLCDLDKLNNFDGQNVKDNMCHSIVKIKQLMMLPMQSVVDMWAPTYYLPFILFATTIKKGGCKTLREI